MEQMGLTLSTLTPEVRNGLQLEDDATGVAVIAVDETTDAFEKGIRAGDVITEVDHVAVAAPKDVEGAFDEARESGRKSALLKVEREGDSRFVGLSLN